MHISKEHPLYNYISIDSHTVRLPSGTIPEEFFRAICNYVVETGQLLTAKPPGSFSQESQLSLMFTPGNFFSSNGVDYENHRFFAYEFAENESTSIRDIAPLLFRIHTAYPTWNVFLRWSNQNERALSAEQVHHLIELMLEHTDWDTQQLLTAIFQKKSGKKKNR